MNTQTNTLKEEKETEQQMPSFEDHPFTSLLDSLTSQDPTSLINSIGEMHYNEAKRLGFAL